MSRPLFGIDYPFRIVGGGVRGTSGDEKVQSNLRQLLTVRLGERVMNRAYGTGLYSLVQEPNDAALRARVQYEIETALGAFLPEARLVGPVTTVSQQDELYIAFDYIADPQQIVRRLELRIS